MYASKRAGGVIICSQYKASVEIGTTMYYRRKARGDYVLDLGYGVRHSIIPQTNISKPLRCSRLIKLNGFHLLKP